MIRRLLLISFGYLAWLICISSYAHAQDLRPDVTKFDVDNPARVLFVGNSYIHYGEGVHNHVRRMVVAAGLHDPEDLEYRAATISGASLVHHDLDGYLSPDRFDMQDPFDVVILQGHSGAALSQASRSIFKTSVIEYADKIQRASGEVALYMTHAYVRPHRSYRPDMIRDIEKLYTETGNHVGAPVIPVGLAFEEAYRRAPDILLHDPSDGSHPSPAGTYLAAATVFASLYDASPIGNSYDYFNVLDGETVLFLQTVADETVTAFHERD